MQKSVTNPCTEHHYHHIGKSLFILTTPHRQAETEDANPYHHTVSQEHPTVSHTVTQEASEFVKIQKNAGEHTASH